MRQQRLGHSDLWISRLGLGTVKLGRDQGVRYPTGVRIPDNRAAGHLLDVASELGINLLDTAPAYGSSEERLGALLAGRLNVCKAAAGVPQNVRQIEIASGSRISMSRVNGSGVCAAPANP